MSFRDKLIAMINGETQYNCMIPYLMVASDYFEKYFSRKLSSINFTFVNFALN